MEFHVATRLLVEILDDTFGKGMNPYPHPLAMGK